MIEKLVSYINSIQDFLIKMGTDILIEKFCIKLSVSINRDKDVRGDNKFIGTIYIPTANDERKLELRLWKQEKWERAGLIIDFILKLITGDLNDG